MGKQQQLLVAFMVVAALAPGCNRGGPRDVSAKQSSVDTPVWGLRAGALSPPGRSYASVAQDPATGKLVLYGGYSNGRTFAETWTFDGSAWQLVCDPASCAKFPPARQGAHLARDDFGGTGSLILTGGCQGTCSNSSDFFNDTWRWDGTKWTQLTPTGKPDAVAFGAIAYDPSTGLTVLHGGLASSLGYSTAAYTWGGFNWTDACGLGCSTPPAARARHAMAYEAQNTRLIIYGGMFGGTEFSDTWALKWSGVLGRYQWSQVIALGEPGAHYGHSLASDPAGGPMLLFGGVAAGQAHNGIYAWNGAGWSQAAAGGPPPEPRQGAAWALLGGPSGGFFLWGGREAIDETGYGDTWKISESQIWQKLTDAPRVAHGTAYDPGGRRTLVFGGFDGALRSDLWDWDGAMWRRRFSPESPPPTALAGVALDETRNKLHVIGGGDLATMTPGLGTWWVYDLATSVWAQQCFDDTCLFPGLMGQVLVYDRDRDCLVLHGGRNSSGFADVRIYERCGGGAWQEVCSGGSCGSSRPTARSMHLAVYDQNRHRTVIHGGCSQDCASSLNVLGDTWEWDGSQWHAGASGGPSLSAATMAYDTRRKKSLVAGGATAGGISGVMFEYDGASWTTALDPTAATKRQGAAMAYDRERGVMVLHGGSTGTSMLGDTWEGYSWGNGCTTNADCDDALACITGFCCSDATCTGQCQVCAQALGAPADGVCGQAVRGYPDPTCPNGLVCGDQGSGCLSTCASDADCRDGYYCANNGACMMVKAPGSSCNPGVECKDTTACRLCGALGCVDGVCCQSACDGVCEQCTPGTGTCAPVPDGQEDGDECPNDSGGCGIRVCNGARACRYVGAELGCSEATCVDGTLIHAASCDGSGACPSPATSGCSGFACTGNVCGTTCTPNTPTGCAAGFTCNSSGNACEGGKAAGDTCTADGQCHSNFCAGGRCCTSECKDTDPACGGACNSSGACTYPTSAKSCSCGGSAGLCTGSGDCDCQQHDGGVADGGGDAARPDGPIGDGAPADAVGPQQDGPAPDGGEKRGTTSFLGCRAAPTAGASALPLLLLALVLLRRR